MFYFASKALRFLINPLCWLLFLIFYIVKTNSKKRKKIAFYSSLFILVFMGNEFIFNEVITKWEIENQDIQGIDSPYDYALVLVGQQGRLSTAIQLYRNGKVRNICVLGRNPNTNLKSRLLKIGIPEEHFFLEENSRNTYEHAKYFRDFLDEHQPQALDTSTFLMITTANHVKRAKMCFDKQNISVTPFSINYISQDAKYVNLLDIFPKAVTLHHWQVLIKEWLGIVTYKAMGYI